MEGEQEEEEEEEAKGGEEEDSKKVLVKTMANTLQIGVFLLFESSCF